MSVSISRNFDIYFANVDTNGFFLNLISGLNHVVRKETIPLDEFGNKLIPVPGGSEGPGGIWYDVVCSFVL